MERNLVPAGACLLRYAHPGTCIETAVDEALETANDADIPVLFMFNGWPVVVEPGGDRLSILADARSRKREPDFYFLAFPHRASEASER